MPAPFHTGRGTVAGFDDHEGQGTVRDDAGGEWPFHCTAIAAASRPASTPKPIMSRKVQ